MSAAVPDTKVAVISLSTELPWFTVLSPSVESEKSNAGLTVKRNDVSCSVDPLVPLTVTIKGGGLMEVLKSVVITSVTPHCDVKISGVQESLGEKEKVGGVIPTGTTLTVKEMSAGSPEVMSAVI